MTAIEIENLSKQYTLGTIGSGTLWRDMNVWWSRMRGKPNPYLKIGQINDRTQKAEGDYVWALHDINLKIEEGDVVGIIGNNGAGKSTLLKILSRVTTPTTGRITTYGRIASLLEVGTGFHQEMTGRENIYMNGAIMGMTRAEITRKLDEIVDFAGVAKYIDTPVKRYSSGMTVRLGFAVAAFLEPEILVVDEVLAVGDADFQQKAIGKMKDVSQSEGRTVLFVSHNLSAVRNLCNRGIVLCQGTSFFDGTSEESVDFYTALSINGRNNLIVDHISKQADFLSISKILINGTEYDETTIKSGQQTIKILIEGITQEDFSASVQFKIRTINGLSLACYSEGAYLAHLETYQKGKFCIEREILLPSFVGQGDCYAFLEINKHSQAGVFYYMLAWECSLLHFEGSTKEYGHPLSINTEGFVGLVSKSIM